MRVAQRPTSLLPWPRPIPQSTQSRAPNLQFFSSRVNLQECPLQSQIAAREQTSYSYHSHKRRRRDGYGPLPSATQNQPQAVDETILPPGTTHETTAQTISSPATTSSSPSVIFGSRLAGPAQRRRDIAAKSVLVAGVAVPPRPEEPDNCCMSGCVNCVWDTYRDEVEAWAGVMGDVRRRLDREADGGARNMERRDEIVGASMDDDGVESVGNWSWEAQAEKEVGDLMKDVPVGIREFMRTEKRLKEKKTRVIDADVG